MVWFEACILSGMTVFTATGHGHVGCFLPDMPVSLADGTRIPINSVVEGDAVLSWSDATNTTTPSTVVKVLRYETVSPLIDVHLPSDAGTIVSTEDHPYWSYRRQMLVSANPQKTHADYEVVVAMVNQTETLHGEDGHPVSVQVRRRQQLVEPCVHGLCDKSIEKMTLSAQVVTLQLDEHHWFFVHGVRVHNKGPSHHIGGGGGGGAFHTRRFFDRTGAVSAGLISLALCLSFCAICCRKSDYPAQECRRKQHETQPRFSHQMAAFDSSYNRGWRCGQCLRQRKFGVQEPFQHCPLCKTNFCSQCRRLPLRIGLLVEKMAQVKFKFTNQERL
jgi:hypothetical protein